RWACRDPPVCEGSQSTARSGRWVTAITRTPASIEKPTIGKSVSRPIACPIAPNAIPDVLRQALGKEEERGDPSEEPPIASSRDWRCSDWAAAMTGVVGMLVVHATRLA